MKGFRAVLAAAAAGAALAAFAAAARAQHAPPGQEDLKKLHAEKVAEPWFRDGGWTDDFDAAREAARKAGKPILAYFSRSYSP